MEVLTFNVDSDQRQLVDDTQDFNVDFSDSKYSWIQARQYEDQMRQTQVNVKHGDGTPFDLTGCNVIFEGWLPDGTHRIYDANHCTMLDAAGGQFRYDFPAPAFAIAGSFKQAFFRIVRQAMSVTTLEFSVQVLADKVISGLIPSDYITPFNDLYGKLADILANAGKDTQAQADIWTAKFQAALDKWNGDYSTFTATIKALNSQMDSLAAQIQDKNLVTTAALQVWEDKMDAIMQGIVSIDESIDTGGEVPSSLKQQLADFKAKLPTNLFKLAIISDTHYEDRFDETKNGSYPFASDGYQHLAAFMLLRDSVDVMIANGDDINGLDYSLENGKQELSKYVEKLLTDSGNTDAYAMLGNHDDGAASSFWRHAITLDDKISDDELKTLFHTHECENGEVRDDGSLYFYKDYSDKKIRLIGLNTEDIPANEVDSGGAVVYTRWLNHGYSQAQFNWLVNHALADVPEGYQLVVVGHTPPQYGWKDAGANQFNDDLMAGLLNAVSSGGAYTASSNSTVPTDMRVSVNADFSQQGARPVTAFLAGHIHYEMIEPLDHFTICTVTHDVNYNANVVPGSAESMAFTVFAFDTANRTVTAYGFGQSTDRSFKY